MSDLIWPSICEPFCHLFVAFDTRDGGILTEYKIYGIMCKILLHEIQHKTVKLEEGRRLFEIKEVGNFHLKRKSGFTVRREREKRSPF